LTLKAAILAEKTNWTTLRLNGIFSCLRPSTSRLTEIYPDQAEHFIDYSLRMGFDSVEGEIYSPTSPEDVATDSKGWWEQCEATRVLMRFAVVHNTEDLCLPLGKTIDVIQRNFVGPEHRGWFMSTGDDRSISGIKEISIRLIVVLQECVWKR